MAELRTIDVQQGVFADNDRIADRVRDRLREQGTFLVNLMASPGAGKTTLLLKTIEHLRDHHHIGVMEADIDATVDAEAMERAGVRSIQVHTGGECAMDAAMTEQALKEFKTDDLDLLFLENIGNLVCPAETDTGAAARVVILSVPEGDDKPLKYPLMFQVADVVLVSKVDTRSYFPFDDAAFVERVHQRNPQAQVIFLSARTGEGMNAWYGWLEGRLRAWRRA